MCGGTFRDDQTSLKSHGLSPRVRGNPGDDGVFHAQQRSIPACAGEPGVGDAEFVACWVYPRVCGGTGCDMSRVWTALGLSPRVRGNPTISAAAAEPDGSIPACAGEPRFPNPATAGAKVYPRVCGGTHWRGREGGNGRGLSPRVRGNRVLATDAVFAGGSIPACAGEPRPSGWRRRAARVYPRVCGGTRYALPARFPAWGLSPRVRGNHYASLFIDL